MNLREYQAKQIFANFNIPVPRGKIAHTVDEVTQIVTEPNHFVVLKPQLKI